MVPAGLGNRIRFAAGAACVLVAATLFVTKVPDAYRSASATADSNRKYDTPTYRLLSTGDMLDIPYELSAAAFQYIPPGAAYKVVLPGTPEAAQAGYGIQPITYDTFAPWLRYLLLPAKPVDASEQAPYIVCWGCDTTPYDTHTDWLWHNDQGAGIGHVH